jgi:hypothetical protein
LLCAEIVALKNEQPPIQRRLATLADVETAVAEALMHGSFFFADIRQNQVDETGLAVLLLLAKRGERVITRLADLAEIGVDTAVLEKTLQSLKQRELIEVVADGFCFQVELVRRWFAQEAV